GRPNAGGQTTEPTNVTKRLPPVAAPAWPAGALRATSDRNTPFQAIAVVPSSAHVAYTSHDGQRGEKAAASAQAIAIRTPSACSVRRAASQRSDTMPHPMRPATPPKLATVRPTPAAIQP